MSANTIVPTLTSQISTQTSIPTSGASNGTPEQIAEACTNGSKALVAAYVACIPLFPTSAPSTKDADNGGRNFVTCICNSEWQAGSASQLASSVPICPAIPGITKGGQAAVSSDCAAGQPASQQRRIIMNFGLQTIVGGKPYIPLAGLPPGVTSGASSMGVFLWSLILALTL